MADNAPVPNEPDIQDVSLIDTPIDAPSDQPSDLANDKPNDGANTEDKPTEDEQKPDDAKSTEATDQPKEGQEDEQKPDDAPKEDRQVAARRAWQDRQRTRQQIAEQLDQQYGPKSQEQLEQEGLNQAEAKVEALRQEFAYKEERNRVSELTSSMRADAVEVAHDFPVYRQLNPDGTKNPDYDPEFTAMVDQQYQLASRLKTSDDGRIIYNAEVPLYDYYQQMAAIRDRGISRGTQQGQAAMQQMMSRTENPGGSSSTNRPAPGSLEELEERIGDAVIT